MAVFLLKESCEHYIELCEHPKRFDADSPVTNLFFDDTNGQVFTVRSGGVTGVTVNGMDDSKSTSFRMEDRGPIISIKFSPDHKILGIQRNRDNQNATVEFMNFQDLVPTNVEYSHTCKWKNAKLLGFVWARHNEIAFITDHGIELLQVIPDKKQLKTLKATSFYPSSQANTPHLIVHSGAWFSWCAQSKVILLAGNNGALLQPFSLNTSTLTKWSKLELEGVMRPPVAARDVVAVRVGGAAWCALFRHATPPGPTEVWLLPVAAPGVLRPTHVLRTGLAGRFALSVLDDLVVVHHQSSQSSLLFDIQESGKPDPETNMVHHVPLLPPLPMKEAYLGDQKCPMYTDSADWVVFQPDFMIDARLGCLWQVLLTPAGLAHKVDKDELPRIVASLLRRADGADTVYRMLHQMVDEADCYLQQLAAVFDEINTVSKEYNGKGVLISQHDMCARVLSPHQEGKYIVQVVTCYMGSLVRCGVAVQQTTGELCVRALASRGKLGAERLRAFVRRGCLPDDRALACQLLSLGHLQPAYAQLALDMLWRKAAHEEIVEVLLSWEQAAAAAGAARAAGAGAWPQLPARKLLAAARRATPPTFLAVYHALLTRNERSRGSPHFLKAEQCDSYVEYYKQLMTE